MKSFFILSTVLLAQCAIAAANNTITTEVVIFRQTANPGLSQEAWPSHPALPLAKTKTRAQCDASSFSLNRDARRLRQKGYVILDHEKWRQAMPVSWGNHATAIHNKNLKGVIRIAKTNFFTVKANLLASFNGQAYPLKQTRRLKANEMHYFDNPAFGMLMLIKNNSCPLQVNAGE